MKALKAGWVKYTTLYSLWAGTQPGRFELESGLDRRFFIIDIEMTPAKELEYKRAQRKQAQMSNSERVELASMNMDIRRWFLKRQHDIMQSPPTGIIFDERVEEWLERPEVRSFESDLFRRLCIGYTMMREDYVGGEVLYVDLTPELTLLLESSLSQRRNVMDADLMLIKDTFWQQDIPKSTLLKEVERMITNDYQAAKRWMEESLMGQTWYHEYVPRKEGRGRKGITCRIGAPPTPEVQESIAKKVVWGGSTTMRTEREIRQHLDETEDPIVERTLAWVLTSNDSPCPMCANPHHKVWEVKDNDRPDNIYAPRNITKLAYRNCSRPHG